MKHAKEAKETEARVERQFRAKEGTLATHTEGNEGKRPGWKIAEEPLRGFIHGPPGTGPGLSLNAVFLLSAFFVLCNHFWLEML